MALYLLFDGAGCLTSTSAIERIDLTRLDVQAHSDEVARMWFCYSVLLFHLFGDLRRFLCVV